MIDGYIWSIEPAETIEAESGHITATHSAGDDFAAFAARRLILAEMHRRRGALDTLDQLHALAFVNDCTGR